MDSALFHHFQSEHKSIADRMAADKELRKKASRSQPEKYVLIIDRADPKETSVFSEITSKNING